MNITDLMNYRYNNPNGNVKPDKEIALKIAANQNISIDNLEQALLWGSMSKECNEISAILNTRMEEMKYVNEEGFAKTA